MSLREIATGAGHGNNNAVQYHFGTKAALIEAIFTIRVAAMENRRAAMLDDAEKAGELASIARLVRMICLPHLDLKDELGRFTYASFLGQYFLREHPSGLPHPNDIPRDDNVQVRRIIKLLRDALKHLPPAIRDSRIALGMLMFINMLIRHSNARSDQNSDAAFAVMVEDTIAMIEANLRTPFTGPHPSDHDVGSASHAAEADMAG